MNLEMTDKERITNLQLFAQVMTGDVVIVMACNSLKLFGGLKETNTLSATTHTIYRELQP
jgi:hypothetical protein